MLVVGAQWWKQPISEHLGLAVILKSHHKNRGLQKGLQLGPRRAIPLSLLARDWPEALKHLEEQFQNPIPQATDGRFVMPVMPNGIPIGCQNLRHVLLRLF